MFLELIVTLENASPETQARWKECCPSLRVPYLLNTNNIQRMWPSLGGGTWIVQSGDDDRDRFEVTAPFRAIEATLAERHLIARINDDGAVIWALGVS